MLSVVMLGGHSTLKKWSLVEGLRSLSVKGLEMGSLGPTGTMGGGMCLPRT